MNKAHNNMDQISKEMEQLASTSKEIERIVTMVTSIAEQTNLLALNAAIEAAELEKMVKDLLLLLKRYGN